MSRHALRLTAIATGMACVGLVAGAAIAAPDQLLPTARALGTLSLELGRDAWAAAGGRAAELPALAARVANTLLGDRSPRRLAMLVAGALAIALAAAAVISRRRSVTSRHRSAGSDRAGRRYGPMRSSQRGTGLLARRRTQATSGVRLPDSAVLPVGSAPLRRRAEGDVPRHVQSLAAQGVSVADIARRTGLPLDAISLLLALAPETRQAPPSAA
jgi:hypothetical protein